MQVGLKRADVLTSDERQLGHGETLLRKPCGKRPFERQSFTERFVGKGVKARYTVLVGRFLAHRSVGKAPGAVKRYRTHEAALEGLGKTEPFRENKVGPNDNEGFVVSNVRDRF